MSDPVGHGLAAFPEISVDRAALHLRTHALAKVEISYPCRCGATVRTSNTLPEGDLYDPIRYASAVRAVADRSRDGWGDHIRG